MGDMVVVDGRGLLERRQRLFDLHSGQRASQGNLEVLSKEFDCSVQTLKNDWVHRKEWLRSVVDDVDSHDAVLLSVAEWDAFLQRCAEMADRYDKDGCKSQANTAMKNYREGLQAKNEFFWAVGLIPRVPEEYLVDKRQANVEVKLDQSDLDSLRRIRSAVNRQNTSPEKSSGLH